jgi:hypothetical protein
VVLDGLQASQVRLVAATPALLRAELRSTDELGYALAAPLPRDWPPETWDRTAVRWLGDHLAAHPDEVGWWAAYLVPPTASGGVHVRASSPTVSESTTAPAEPGTEPTVEADLPTIVELCKKRGIIFPSSEIYGGFRSTWDYGPLGVELKENVKRSGGVRWSSCARTSSGSTPRS